MCGGVLVSHTRWSAVPSALVVLASGFGMDTGRFPTAMTTTQHNHHNHPPCKDAGHGSYDQPTPLEAAVVDWVVSTSV